MLKTDFKDAMYDGQRKYRITQNPDGTVSMADATTYTQEGDKFGANEVNETNAVVNKILTQRTLTLTSAGWSASYPYTQTVTVTGITSEDQIKVIGVHIPENATVEQVKAWNKAAGFLIGNPGGVGNGQITFKAYKKPEVDVQIITEGG